MARQTKEGLLEDLRRNKRNRELEEIQELLRRYGFTFRPAKEQGGVWVRGQQTVTLPRPHGTKSLAPTYIKRVIEAIDAAEIEDEIKKAEEEAKNGRGGNGWQRKRA